MRKSNRETLRTLALSLMLRIVLISIGFYLALMAAGFDLNKLGFIIGALGVGIGFGLQTGACASFDNILWLHIQTRLRL